MSPTEAGEELRRATFDIAVEASGDRRSLEALYLELRQLAKQAGLEIEYRLTQKPER